MGSPVSCSWLNRTQAYTLGRCGYCAIDLFSCNLGLDLKPLIQELQRLFKAQNVSIRKLDRNAQVPEWIGEPALAAMPA